MSPLDLPTNLYNRSSAVDPSFYNQPQVGKPTWGYNYPTALRRLPSVIGHHPHPQKTATIGLPSPLKKTPSIGLRQRRGASPSRKTAEERFHMLARGWLAYPVTPIHPHLPPKSGCRNVIPRFANNLYNRSSAVDYSFNNQPQVGEPTWGYNYPTALRRLPHPSSAIPKNALRHRPPSPSRKKRRRAVVEIFSLKKSKRGDSFCIICVTLRRK